MRRSTISPVSGYTSNNRVTLVKGGKDYFSLLLELIQNAVHSIHLHVYIFDGDETGKQVANALIEAANRKVEVYLLFDGYASKNLPPSIIRAFNEAGVHFRMFEPVFQTTNFYFGRRLHHKFIVVDARYSMVGGINISNKYNDHDSNPAWLDWAVFAEGDVSIELLKVSIQLWSKTYWRARKIWKRQEIPPRIGDKCRIRVRRNDWVQRKTQISRSYFEMFRKANEEIIIMSSYFIPGYLFRNHLLRACRRNVRVRVILAGTSDIKIAKHAERYIYGWLLRHGIEIHEFEKTVLHGKLATYDGDWVTIGSYNVNNISAFASIELNLDIHDRAFAGDIRQRLNQIIDEDCVPITKEDYNTRFNFYHRFIQWASYNIVRVLFYLFTFYFKQRKAG
jgi:cardiolipin synthase A/B